MSLEVSSIEAKASISLSMGKAVIPMAETSVSNDMVSLTSSMYSSGVQPLALIVDSKRFDQSRFRLESSQC